MNGVSIKPEREHAKRVFVNEATQTDYTAQSTLRPSTTNTSLDRMYGDREGNERCIGNAGGECATTAELSLLHERIQQVEDSVRHFWKRHDLHGGPVSLSINGLELPVNHKKRKLRDAATPVDRALFICRELYDKVNVRPSYRILRRFRYGSSTAHKALRLWHEERIQLQDKLSTEAVDELQPIQSSSSSNASTNLAPTLGEGPEIDLLSLAKCV